MKYFVILLILVGFTGIAFGQYIGDKIPPNSTYDDQGKLVFPPSYVDFYYSNPNFEKYSVIAEQYRYVIPYIIPNGTISKISINCNNVEMVLDVSTTVKQGWLTLALPRQLIDSKMGSHEDDAFFVLVNSAEVHYSDITSEKLRLLNIPSSNDTVKINIIGVNYPEHMGENACNGKHDPPFSYILSPLKQFKSGISKNEITCKEGLILIAKIGDDSLACVKSETKRKLVDRGWTSNKIMENESSHYIYKTNITIEEIKNILSKSKDIDTIFSEFGQPDNDIGSGIHIYTYNLSDLTQIWIGYTDRILFVSHVDADGNVLEKLFSEENEN